jgi:hypothetical protein
LLSLILPVIGAANIELVVKMKAGICSQI